MPVATHFWTVILAAGAITVLTAWAIPQIHIQNDLMFMLPDHNPVKQSYMDTEEQFGNPGGIVITISSEKGIYQPDLIDRVRKLGKRCQEMNVRIPARQLENTLHLTSTQSLALAGWLQSLSADPGFTAARLAGMLNDPKQSAENIGEALPPFVAVDDPDTFSKELAEALARKAVSNPALSAELFSFSRQTTDRRGHFRSVWVDQVVSLTESNTVWPEFTDRTEIERAMAPYGFTPGPEWSRFTDALLEEGIARADDILAYGKSARQNKLFSPSFLELLDRNLTPAAAGALARAMSEAPKQIRVANLVPRDTDASIMDRIRARLHGWSFFEKGLYSRDEKSLLVMVRTAPNLDQPNRALLLDGIKSALRELFDNGPYTIRMAGYSVVDEAVGTRMIHDVAHLLPLVIAVVLLFLYLSFRTVSGVLYPMLTVLLAVVWCIGIMSLLGVPLTIVAVALPVLLVAVGSAYGIHLVHYFSHHHGGKGDTRGGVAETLSNTGVGVIIAGLTTVAGFASLGFNDIVALRDFGVFAALGVLLALSVSLTLVCALLIRFGARVPNRKPTRIGAFIDRFTGRFMGAVSTVSSRNPKKVLLIAAVLLGGALLCLSDLKVEMNSITFFKKSSDIRRADAFINREFAGTVDLRVIFSSTRKNGALDPVVLDTMQDLAGAVRERHPEVGKSMSVVDLICKMNQAFYFNDPAYYRIPHEKDLAGEQTRQALINHLSSYIDKYQRSDVRPFIDGAKQQTVLTFLIDTGSSAVAGKVLGSIRELLDGPMGDGLRRENIAVHTAGNAALYAEAEQLIVRGQMWSIAFSVAIVLILVALIMKSVRYGLLAITPLCTTVVINFGIMGLTHIPLDPATAIIACVAIGIGVDYGVHYLNRYRQLRSEGTGCEDAIRITAETTGNAIVINAVTVAAGFSVLMLSAFVPLVNSGFLIALTMLVSAAGALTILPAILTLTHRRNDSPTRSES